MLVMVVDSSTPAVTAALVHVADDTDDPQVTVVAERVTVDGRAHGELLAPQIQQALADGGVAPGDLAAVVAGTGPGPFTGLRAGMVTAAALGHALDIPVYGVCSLDGIGHGRPGRLLVATDARRKEIYWAVYDDGARIDGPAVDKPADVAARVHASAAAGDGADRYADVLGLPVVPPLYPSARALAELAADRVRAKAPGETLTPRYLRRPDAVAPGTRKPALP
ncbi:tRNA (adenosine(37)-N6)-threonylcarbamoyltransferase complex dimerization subunit type 1 TsaB [Dactylosporangium aurantiacum]|uniref:tRNA (Adenosine(37)-N6)-threonylcarbamoyltransferase complex dimerization subunit type 1 TsaB n=1 Tax=Dactylosporangium aurantiacum TaxID=35754 RepID=A0A9Q9IJX3_9ACTN|nr:tRNA (adenosine(37)-N6)-threonylcarbamoyltransferase complex dimerization subunit type 1 TsaB [Dactylosporangium aurantiacum]MDG6105347.1 tRNA (adenosine(37)-N6)-threonylcarbamoyltransferase complex dimerization subunit type 1 TsaB [Dactylosporangium aurantiacum]UWZ54105.1 tRNA (adenosine(37)-N6)-threonylcarbamoyltransferase complex dimerization subunit type 1 TsaB [Dactylosporangium aurantiacum]